MFIVSGLEVYRGRYAQLMSRGVCPPARETSSIIRKTTMKSQNRTCARLAVAPASPVNPRAAATSATIRKIKAQRNMVELLQQRPIRRGAGRSQRGALAEECARGVADRVPRAGVAWKGPGTGRIRLASAWR